jgi:hypothetical protein
MLKKFELDTHEHGILPTLQQGMFDAGWYVITSSYITELTSFFSIHAMVDPDDNPGRPGLSVDAVSAAVQEFKNGFDSDGDEKEQDG